MSTELITSQEQQVAAPTVRPSLLQVIAAAAADPRVDIDKMRALIEMERAVRKDVAEVEFNAAMARLQPRLPRVVKRREIKGKGDTVRSRYAALEDIDIVTRPLLDEEGFSVSYTTETDAKGTWTIATVRHRLGHSIESKVWVPFDKSEYRTDAQCQGSTISYGKRYSFCNAFNIVVIGQDDDGQAKPLVNYAQVETINKLLTGCQLSEDALRKFMAFAGATCVERIAAQDYDRVILALRKKLAAHQAQQDPTTQSTGSGKAAAMPAVEQTDARQGAGTTVKSPPAPPPAASGPMTESDMIADQLRQHPETFAPRPTLEELRRQQDAIKRRK